MTRGSGQGGVGDPSRDPRPVAGGTGAEALRVAAWEGTNAEWDALVARFGGRSFCHLAGWRPVMTGALGASLHYRVARDGDGEVQGLLPMARVRSRLFGDYLVSMPFLSYGGPLGSPAAREALGHAAAEEAQELGVDLLELRSREKVPGGLKTTDRKITVLLELPEDPEVLWEDGLKAKVRSQVRRPRKDGMEPRIGPEEKDRFYQVFARTMRDLGTPVLPQAFFDEVARELSKQVVFCTVGKGDEPVAAGCGFLYEGEFEITWAGALREHSRSAPNMLLYWSLIEESIRRGARVFNFGRCTPGSGTHRFKRQWGGVDESLPWAQWSPGGMDATPTPKGKKYELATAVWQRLPLGLANTLGPLLSRKIP